MDLCRICTFALVAIISLAAADVTKVGNRIVVGRSTEQDSTVYLLDDAFNIDGIIFAFSAFFTEVNPVDIQIWRPVNPADRSKGYTLIGQWRYSAIKPNRREDIYLQTFTSSNRCFRVSENDRIGLYFPGYNGSVAYDFAFGSASTLQRRMQSQPVINQVYVFDVLSWPYKFSVAAYLDTDLRRYSTGDNTPLCFNDLQIPKEDDGYETGNNMGAVGATGATGKEGPIGTRGAQGLQGDRGNRGEMGTAGATGSTGPMGATGDLGAHGATGPIGPSGARGGTGPSGPRGENGLPGIPGPSGNITVIKQAASSELSGYEDCTWCAKFQSPYLLLAVIIWLVLVTICLMVTILTICCKKQPKSQHYQRNIRKDDNLWKKYENGGFDEKVNSNEENTYSAIEEGRTAF